MNRKNLFGIFSVAIFLSVLYIVFFATPALADDCTPREYNECTGCRESRTVRQNEDCSYNVVSTQFDASCTSGCEPEPQCTPREYNECTGCRQSRTVRQNEDCSYNVVSTQFDASCTSGCEPEPQCTPREYNECTGCETSRRVRENEDCSFTVIIDSQQDSSCTGSTWCPEQCTPREYNECTNCLKSRRVRQNDDCTFSVIIPEQDDTACGGPDFCPAQCDVREFNECTACDTSRRVRQNADCTFSVIVPSQNDPACSHLCTQPAAVTVSGITSCANTGQAVSGATVKLFNDRLNVLQTAVTDGNGHWSITDNFNSAIGGDHEYSFRAEQVNGNTPQNSFEHLKVNSNVIQMTVSPFTSFSHNAINFNFNCPPPQPVNHRPEGWLDSADCNAFQGWTRDPDTTAAIDVHFYADGRAGQGGVFLGSARAGNFRADLCNLFGNGNADCFHGFSFPTPAGLKDNRNHAIFAYGIDSSGGENPLLSGVPKNILCAPPINHPPVLDPIGDKTVKEGELLRFTISGSDPDGDALSFFAFNLPAGAGFDSNTRTFSWTPDFTQAGTYQVTFSVSDDQLSDSETITITVIDVNRPPVLDPIGDKTVQEGQLLEFVITGRDPDVGDRVTFSATNLPRGTVFNPLTRAFSWTPDFTQAGTYRVTFSVSDGQLSDSETITITVIDANRGPSLSGGLVNPTTGTIFDVYTYTVTYSDPDNNPPFFVGLHIDSNFFADMEQADPTDTNYVNGALFTLDVDGSILGRGNHTFSFDASDDGINVIFTPVFNGPLVVNLPPVLDPIGNKNTSEGQLLQFTISGSDPEGDALTFSAANLPSGAVFNPATRTFSWTPDFTQAGTYRVTFSVSDGQLSDSETITITVGNTNRPPVLDPIGNKQVDEGQMLQFAITGSDPDGDAVSFSAANLPAGAVFNPTTRTFRWTPGFTQAGNYQATFTISDGALTDSEIITITVGNVPQAPVIITTPLTEVVEPDLTSFSAVYVYDADAIDADNDTLLYSLAIAPDGATIDQNTGLIVWTPNSRQLGPNFFSLVVTDGIFNTTQSWTVTVRLPDRINIPRRELFVEHVLAPECIEPGNTEPVYVTVENIGLHPLKGFTITTIAFEPDIRNRKGPFDLEAGEKKNTNFYLTVPSDTAPGTYDMRLTFSNDNVRRIKHREFEVRDDCSGLRELCCE